MRQSKLHGLPLLACVLLALPACAGSDNTEAAKGKDDNAAKSGDVAPVEAEPAAGKPVEGDGNPATKPGDGDAGAPEYTLQIEPADATVGTQSAVSIRVVPKETWHINLEYPTSLKVEAPAGVTLANASQKKGDAVKLDEQSCEFAVKLTPSEAGDKVFTGEFKFAVCQDDACAPKTEKLEFTVAVK